MASERAEILTGAAVLAAAVAFVVYAAQGAGLVQSPETYPLTASFRSVEGITVGSDVRLAGVKVGTITDLTLNPQTFFADASLSIRNDVLLPTDLRLSCPPKGFWAVTSSRSSPVARLKTWSLAARSRIHKARSA